MVREIYRDLLLRGDVACHKLVQFLQNSIVPVVVPSVLKGHRTVVQHMQEGLTAGAKWAVWRWYLPPQVEIGVVWEGVVGCTQGELHYPLRKVPQSL